MKKTLIAAVLSFTLLSCQSNEQKAKDLIEKHLSETLHDYDSYQSVKWGELDSTFSTYLTTEEGYKASKSFTFYVRQCREIDNEEGEFYAKLRSEYLDSARLYKSIMDSLERAFVPQHDGWGMDHTYRAKNLNGAYRLTTTRYYFNLELDSVLYSSGEKEE